MNYFLYRQLFDVFNLTKKHKYLIALWMFGVLILITWFLSHQQGWILNKIHYTFSMYYMWIFFIAFQVMFGYFLLKFIFKKNKKILWYVSLVFIVLLSFYSLYNGQKIYIQNIDINSWKIGEKMSIAYLTDLHIDTINDDKYINKIVNIINKQNVDLLLINWDLIDGTAVTHYTFSWFNNIKVPIYATYWNHEIYRWKSYVKKLLDKTNIKLLKNESVIYKNIKILGADSLSSRWWANQEEFKNFLKNENIDDKYFNLLMLHEPTWYNISKNYNVDLQVAWHSHGWQIWPFEYLVRLQFKYIRWLHKIENMFLYVSQWTWSWWPPLRLWTNNEITIINLK